MKAFIADTATMQNVAEIYNRMTYAVNIMNNVIAEYGLMKMKLYCSDNGIINLDFDNVQIIDDGVETIVKMPLYQKDFMEEFEDEED